MGIPDEEIVDAKAVMDMHTCVICQMLLLDPLECESCQEPFCSACIRDSLQAQPRCPNCQKAAALANFRPVHRKIRSELDRIFVRCMKEGCSWVGRLDARSGHQCSHELVAEKNRRIVSLEAEVVEVTGKLCDSRREVEQLKQQVALLERQLWWEKKRKDNAVDTAKRLRAAVNDLDAQLEDEWRPQMEGSGSAASSSSGTKPKATSSLARSEVKPPQTVPRRGSVAMPARPERSRSPMGASSHRNGGNDPDMGGNLQEPSRWPPLHKAVYDGDYEQVRRLLASGADVNEILVGSGQRTAIYYAMSFNAYEILELLLSQEGIRVDTKMKAGKVGGHLTPLEMAKRDGPHSETYQLFVRYGHLPPPNDETADSAFHNSLLRPRQPFRRYT